jgi:hypothetical protein
VDLTPFYFVGSLLMIGGFILTIKIIFTGWISLDNR